MYEKKVDTWDYQLSYLLLKNKGKCIVPKFNLVSNIGFGDEATHTFDAESKNANRKRYEIDIPFKFSPNSESEKKINRYFFSKSLQTKAIEGEKGLAIHIDFEGSRV